MAYHESEYPSDDVYPNGQGTFDPNDFYRYLDTLQGTEMQLLSDTMTSYEVDAHIIAGIAQDLEVNGVDLTPICDLYDTHDRLDLSLLNAAYERARTSEDEYNGNYDRFLIMHRIRHLLYAYNNVDMPIEDILLDDAVIQVFYEMTSDDEAWLKALQVMFPTLGMFKDTVQPVSPDLLHEMAREIIQSGDVQRELQNQAIYYAELYIRHYYGLRDETPDLAQLIGVNAARRYHNYPIVYDITNNPVNYLRLRQDQLEDIYRDILEEING